MTERPAIAPLVFMDIEFPSLLSIGDGAVVGTITKILTHEVTIKSVRLCKRKTGKQALVGAGSVIRCGVTIGEGAVVAVNSFVNRDVLPFQVVGGSPLQDMKKLDKLI
jgi:acetyltransferase-like isoleucine patch superfamily enzyme